MQIEIADDTFRRVLAVKPLIAAVLEEDYDDQMCVDVLFQLSLKGILTDLMGGDDPAVLLQSFYQLAERHPRTSTRLSSTG